MSNIIAPIEFNYSFSCKVDYTKCINNYFNDYTNNLRLQKNESQNSIGIEQKNSSNICGNKNHIDYSYTGKTNLKKDICTTNREYIEISRESSHKGTEISGESSHKGTGISREISGESSHKGTGISRESYPNVYCNWCRKEIYYNDSIGIPIKLLNNRSENKLIFIVDDFYCRFECLYSGFKSRCPSIITKRHPNYMDAEQLLRLMFHKMHPDEILYEAKDWRLRKCFTGGILEDEEYYNNSHFYKELPNIVISCAKMEYEEYSTS